MLRPRRIRRGSRIICRPPSPSVTHWSETGGRQKTTYVTGNCQTHPPLNAPMGFWTGSATVGEFRNTVDVEKSRGWVCGETAGRKEVRQSGENVRGFMVISCKLQRLRCCVQTYEASDLLIITLRRLGYSNKDPG